MPSVRNDVASSLVIVFVLFEPQLYEIKILGVLSSIRLY